MKLASRISGATLVAAAVLAVAGGSTTAIAAPTDRAVFVQNDNTAGNQVIAYDSGEGGGLTQVGAYGTGGLGGALTGSVVDHLASQGGLVYDRLNHLLYAVNAGSDSLSVFAVFGDRLALRQVISSGGAFPVSIAVHGGLVYVLNAEEGGLVQGYTVTGGRLAAIAGSARTLALNTTETPQFTHTPGQVAFSPDGTRLIVTTKANGSAVDVFAVHPSGKLSATPTVNPLPGAVPFAVSFDAQGHLLVSEAAGALASFTLNEGGTITQLDAVATGQAATCWVARDGAYFYTSNAGSASLSGFRSSVGGQLLAPLGNTETDAGTVDATVTGNGRYLYVQAGAAGIVDEYSVGALGALAKVGSATVPGAVGGEGIAAG